jgi:hypothetical protein
MRVWHIPEQGSRWRVYALGHAHVSATAIINARGHGAAALLLGRRRCSDNEQNSDVCASVDNGELRGLSAESGGLRFEKRRDGLAHVAGDNRIEPLTGQSAHRDGLAGPLEGHSPVAALPQDDFGQSDGYPRCLGHANRDLRAGPPRRNRDDGSLPLCPANRRAVSTLKARLYRAAEDDHSPEILRSCNKAS